MLQGKTRPRPGPDRWVRLRQCATALAMAGVISATGPGAVGEAWADVEPCAEGAPWESLCNVEPELRRSFLRLERVAELAHFRERISGMVRNRRVTIEWEWSLTDRETLGGYNRRTHQVLMPPHLRGGPDRVEAAIMAHELWHAYTEHVGVFQPFTAANCLEDERQAFKVGMLFYVRLYAAEAPSELANDTEGFLWLLAREWDRRGGSDAALDALAQEHVVDRGYYFRCALVERGIQ